MKIKSGEEHAGRAAITHAAMHERRTHSAPGDKHHSPRHVIVKTVDLPNVDLAWTEEDYVRLRVPGDEATKKSEHQGGGYEKEWGSNQGGCLNRRGAA